MKIKFVFIAVTIACGFTKPSFAQISPANTEKPNFSHTIPTVDAASLGLYADIPVSLYTGTPEISIPLYEIKLKDFTLPISLSYHASGIKLAQEAGSIGLGWVLNSGGVITRTIRDKDDLDFNLGFKNNTNPLPSPDAIYGYCYLTGNHTSEGHLSKPSLYNEIEPDTEPDIFSYNFNGITGHFVFIKGGNGSIMNLNPENMLKIEYEVGSYFYVTAPDGTKYNFAPTEQTIDFVGMLEDYGNLFGIPESEYRFKNSNIQGRYISWYLSDITLLNGDQITFRYNYGATYPQSSGYETFVRYSYDETKIIDKKQNLTLITAANSALTYSKTLYYNVVVPEKISWKNGYIQFTSSERHDLKRTMTRPHARCRKIDEMEIYRTGESSPLYRINFHNSYFGPLGTIVSESSDKRLYRLRLDSIQVSSDSASISKYKFQYTGTSLPPKDGFGSDRWGYINSTDPGNKHHIMPTVYASEDLINTYSNPDFGSVSINKRRGSILHTGDGNKECNSLYMKLGILSSITYPTGLITSFEYEPHDFGGNPIYNVNRGGGLRINKIISDDEVRTFEYKFPDNTSSGILLNPASYYDTEVVGIDDPRGYKGIYYLLNIQSDMFAPMETAINGVTVGYSRVIEIRNGSDGNVSEESYFFNSPVSGRSSLGFPVQEDSKNGKMYYRYFLDNKNQRVREESGGYANLNLQTVVGYKQNSFYRKGQYSLSSQYARIIRQEELNYSNSSNKITDYEYSSDEFPLPRKVTTKLGSGSGFYQTFVKETHYAYDMPQGTGAMQDLKSQNRLGVPIEELFTLNGTPIIKRLTTFYNDLRRGINPYRIYENRKPQNGNLTYTGGMVPEEYNHVVAEFRNYDIKGNCIQFVGEDNIPIIMLYDKKAVTPVAIIRGAEFNQVTGIVNPDNLVVGNLDFNPESLYAALPDAEIQTAKYNHLSGPLMIKQPSGFKLNFIYDCMGRLIEKRDKDNKIINAYKYNYVNK